jgi:hypothetical protein
MPLVGTRNLSELAAAAPVVANFDTERLEFPGARILQLMYEIDDDAMVSLLPPSLHPTIPPTLVFTVTHVPESPFGAFTMAEVRVGSRSGARPRGLLVHGFCDSADAVEALRAGWGYPLVQANVSLQKRYDRIHAEAHHGGHKVLDMSLMNPEPISGIDLQYLASLNLARVVRDGAEQTRLIQADPDYVFHSADRGQPQLDAFDPAAFNVAGATTNYPVSASYAVADITMPNIRYLVDPEKPPMASVERVG